MIIAAGTKAPFRCDDGGFFSGVAGGDISYLKDQGTVMEQPNPSLRRMAAGSLWKNRLALPPFSFLLPPPHHRLPPPPPPPLSSSLSNHFVHLSHLVCFAVLVSLNADCLS